MIRRMLVFLGVPAGVLLAAVSLGTGRRPHLSPGIERIIDRVEHDPRILVEPGPLAPAHRGNTKLRDCDACHDLAGQEEDTRCLSCHKEIAKRLAGRIGHHGRDLRGHCAQCHADHTPDLIHLDREQFNHDRALYPLRGAHADVACEECHNPEPEQNRPSRFLDIPHAHCADCHEDPHGGQFTGTTCERCHTVAGFKERRLEFSHDEVEGFPLRGAHLGVPCRRCHQPPGPRTTPLAQATFRGLPHECSQCHEDPHKKSLEPTPCRKCHTAHGWKGTDLRFDHQSMGRFSLDATHEAVACKACHDSRVYRPTPVQCAACHEEIGRFLAGRMKGGAVAPSPHAGLVACKGCHDTGVGRQTPDSYAARCAGCHTDRYGALFLARRSRLAQMALTLTLRQKEIMKNGSGDDQANRIEARLAELMRIRSHNFPAAEKGLLQLLSQLPDPRSPGK